MEQPRADLINVTEHIVLMIKRVVAAYLEFNLEYIENQEKKRFREYVKWRQWTQFFLKEFTKLSLADIGEKIGRKDHATVLHACKTVNNLCETDKEYCEEVKVLREIIQENVNKINNRKTKQQVICQIQFKESQFNKLTAKWEAHIYGNLLALEGRNYRMEFDSTIKAFDFFENEEVEKFIMIVKNQPRGEGLSNEKASQQK